MSDRRTSLPSRDVTHRFDLGDASDFADGPTVLPAPSPPPPDPDFRTGTVLLFTYAANPRALAASLEGHSKGGLRYRHLAAGGDFELCFRFTVREPGEGEAAPLVDVQYDLAVDLEATPAALTG